MLLSCMENLKSWLTDMAAGAQSDEHREYYERQLKLLNNI